MTSRPSLKCAFLKDRRSLCKVLFSLTLWEPHGRKWTGLERQAGERAYLLSILCDRTDTTL